jgi:hypothetical protein
LPPTGPSLLALGAQHSASGAAPVTLYLATKAVSHQSICAIETLPGGATVTFQAVIVANAPQAANPSKVAIHPPDGPDRFLLVDTVAPAPGYTASVDIYTTCPVGAPTPGSTLLQAGPQTSVDASVHEIALELATAPAVGATLCAVESFQGAAPMPAVAPIDSSQIVIAAPVAPPSPDSTALKNADSNIRTLDTLCVGARSCLANLAAQYQSFDSQAQAALKANAELQVTDKAEPWLADYNELQVFGSNLPDLLKAGSIDFTQPGPTGRVAHARMLAGIDVSAASAVDPAAKFLLDVSLDVPLTGNKDRPIDARSWLWGYIRLSSIAQPGSVGGISSPTTYVQALTSASPNQIVQSLEGLGGYEFRVHTFPTFRGPGPATISTWNSTPMMISIIADGGIITPVSSSQATPNIYIATSSLETYYTKLASTSPTPVNTTNAGNITKVCSITTPPTECYVAQFAQDRTHFFRDYSAGVRIKRYYYNNINQAYIFPAIFDITAGQSEYVTAGSLRRWVLHFGGSTPLSLLPGVTAYAYADLVLQKNTQSSGDQQFPLATASSNITISSPNVAAIYVSQPDRDRYRFGVAYDLSTLKKLFTATKQ